MTAKAVLNQAAFTRACAERDAARAKLAKMQAARSWTELEELWSEFLTCTQRFFNKMAAATKDGPSKGWFDRVKAERKSDEMLAYVHQARHADEHGVEPITKTADASSLTINAKPGSGSTYIRSMVVAGGQVFIDSDSADNLDIQFIPAGVRLVAVVNKGVRFEAPARHLGKPIDNPGPVSVAGLTLAYLDKIIDEAAAFQVTR